MDIYGDGLIIRLIGGPPCIIIGVMDQSIDQTLMNSLAYGTVVRSEIPSDLDEYEVNLIKQTHEDSSVTMKLEFTPKKGFRADPFSINIDAVRRPANAILLIKHGERTDRGQKDPKYYAKASAKIKYKMTLSVEKDQHKWEEEEDNGDERDSNSDIPRRRIINLLRSRDDSNDDSEVMGQQGRKRRRNSDSEDD